MFTPGLLLEKSGRVAVTRTMCFEKSLHPRDIHKAVHDVHATFASVAGKSLSFSGAFRKNRIICWQRNTIKLLLWNIFQVFILTY